MKLLHRITLALLVSTLIPLSGSATNAASQPVSHLLAQQSDEAVLQEATRLNKQAFELYQQGRYAEAEPLYQRALQIYEQSLGDTHPDVATTLNNLALLYHDQGNYAEAEPLYQRALQIYEKSLGNAHPDVATTLNNLAMLYQSQGNYAEAEPLYQRALQISEQSLGDTHPDVATTLNNLAELYRVQGNYAEAFPLYQRALQIYEQSLGDTHPLVANTFNNLAILYQSQGNYAEAEPLYQRALQICEQSLEDTHPEIANTLNNLAELYRIQSNYAEAEPLYQRALQIYEQSLGNAHPEVATTLNNLALLYHDQGNYAEAEPLYQRALQIYEQSLGNAHPKVANPLNNLAFLYRDQGNYAEAEHLYQRALQILEQSLGDAHPLVAASLNNLAELYQSQGNYAEAEPLYQRALQIYEQSTDDAHPDVAVSLGNLALLYQSQGRFERVLPLLSRQVSIEEATLAQVLSLGSETRKQAYANTLQNSTDIVLSFSEQSPQRPELTRLALETILRRKGRVLDATAADNQRLRANLSEQDKSLFDQLQVQRTQLSNLLFNPPEQESANSYRAEVADLKQQIGELENTLAQRSAEFRVEVAPVTIEAVQAQLPQDATLVEFMQYQPFDFENNSFQSSRYAAYVLSAQGKVKTVDLGEAAVIDQAISKLRQALLEPQLPIKPAARELDALLMQPIRAQIGNATHLLLSPDGQLNLLPFAALVDENDQYLIETYQLTHLTSGRDLLRFQLFEPSQQPPMIMGDPDYEQAAATVAAAPSPNNQRSFDASSLTFLDLPGTAEEANVIAALLPDRTLLLEAEATENALKQLQSPSILHVATHGFFLQDLPLVPPPDPEITRSFGEAVQPQGPQENPLLRSGLVLAGANQRKSGDEDGILTALEATGLDLRGTQLVVLSACETGIGQVSNGEGVYGLRRSLVIAGAQTQLISLWLVSDTGTKDLMIDYYERLLSGQGRSEALRQTQLAMLNSEKYQHPYYWAAFISSGNWSPLNMN